MKTSYTGPLFIVGLSRSGTKLIRDLLNRNDQISIPEIETHFIPGLLKKNQLTVMEVYQEIKTSLFVKRFDTIEWPSLKTLESIKSIDNSEDLIESLLKYYAIEGEDKIWRQDRIWGDKTPSYLRELDLLKMHFPQCKFLHIIRDPRDRALSVNKTWGKSMYRATELWRREIEDSRKWMERQDSYMELKYEDLLADPEQILRRICTFLSVDFTEKMLILKKPSEKYGASSELLKVKKNNSSKFESMNKSQIKRIEEIAYPMMKEKGYTTRYAKNHRSFSASNMLMNKISDYLKFKVSVKLKDY